MTSSARSRSSVGARARGRAPRRVREGPAAREEPRWLSLETIVALHAEQIERFGGSHGILDRGAVEAAAARPRTHYRYRPDTDLADLAAVYVLGFAARHGFVDGNKRVGAAAMLVFLAVNGSPLHAPPAELYALVMDVANGRVAEEQAAAWIRMRLGHVD